ncbi:MAG: hypothetical protein K0R24_2047 [Gammaproteobacteria bacterium]|jgi:hypothetical protein|nr:hypothetical protein [Gammaproteobacteria bacterium]
MKENLAIFEEYNIKNIQLCKCKIMKFPLQLIFLIHT